MIKRVALMDSISSNLNDFLKKITNNLPLPDKKFLRDSLIGLIRCGGLSMEKRPGQGSCDLRQGISGRY